MSFPLYELLKTNVPDRDLTVLERTKLLDLIPKLDQEGHDLIYALIKCFFLEHSGSSLEMPFEGKFQKEDILFNLKKLPVKLRRILYKFVIAHNNKLEEDKKMFGNA